MGPQVGISPLPAGQSTPGSTDVDRAAGGRPPLTPEQREIVESGDGPVVVIAGAGTGKTRVIVERVRWLLETKGTGTRDANGRLIPAEPAPRDRPFDGPLTPEQILVLTYNVKAAASSRRASMPCSARPFGRVCRSPTSTASATAS